IVLAFYIFKSFIFDQNSSINNDLTLTRQYFEFVLMQLPRIIFELFFWIGIIPLIILSGKEYLTRQQKLRFEEHSISISYIYKINIGIFQFWKGMMGRYFVPLFQYKSIFSVLGFLMICFSTLSMFNITLMPEPDIKIIAGFISVFEMILGFILFLVPVIIVLENKTFADGAKKSVHIVRNKLKECIIFNIILVLINPFNILFIAMIISHYAAIPWFNYLPLTQVPGFEFFQLILASGWFIFCNAAITGFYLSISEERKLIQQTK
ncbi:MAG: hypothetical protein WA144_03555, partial [Candidatus Methanoperedens sp.]